MQYERISPLATRSGHRDMLAIDQQLIEAKSADAKRNGRKREIHCFHDGDGDTLHRMLNAIEPGSYARPHRHLDPPKAESMLIVAGSVGIVSFDDDGRPDAANRILLSKQCGVIGVDIRAEVWHTILALEPGSVVFEVKPGPYHPANDKDFASWAPDGSDPTAAADYLARLEQLFRG